MIGIVLPAEPSVAGSVKDRFTGPLAWPVTSKRPAFVRSMAAIVLFTPGNTFPKLNGWAPSTLIGVCTLAVAVMLALFDWAWSAVPARARAATTRDSFVMLRISLLLVWCLAISQLEAIRLLHTSGGQSWQGLCQAPVSLAMSNFLTNCQEERKSK